MTLVEFGVAMQVKTYCVAVPNTAADGAPLVMDTVMVWALAVCRDMAYTWSGLHQVTLI